MDIVKVWSDDWTGYYVDGKLLIEGHSVDGYQLLGALVDRHLISVSSVLSREADAKWMEYNGTLPNDLSKVKTAKSNQK